MMTEQGLVDSLELTPNSAYRKHIEIAIAVYGVRQQHIIEGLQLDQVVNKSIALLDLYQMDSAFLENKPENALLTLAIAQDLLQAQDPAEKEKLLLAFSFATHNNESYSSENFNYSARIREQYNSDYTPKVPPTRRVSQIMEDERAMVKVPRAETLGKLPYQDFNITPGVTILGIEIHPFMLDLCKKFGIASERLEEIEIRYIERFSNTGFIAAVERLGFGKARIIVSGSVSRKTLEHESIHAIMKDILRRGYRRLWWFALNEAWTEMMTEQPATYINQRAVLQMVLDNSDNSEMSDYLLQAIRGEHMGRMKFMKALIQGYGLAAYTQLGLLDPDAHRFIVNEVGKVNRIFNKPENALTFFSHPKAV